MWEWLDIMEQSNIKSAVESILFITDKPVSANHLAQLFDNISEEGIKFILNELQSEYEINNRGLRIQYVAEGYRMTSNPENSKYIMNFLKERKRVSLSLAALECLALIAYKQPLTIPEINRIRDIDSNSVVKKLLHRNLIKILGKKDVPGKPILYGTSKEFLIHFGIQDLNNLPPLEEIKQILE